MSPRVTIGRVRIASPLALCLALASAGCGRARAGEPVDPAPAPSASAVARAPEPVAMPPRPKPSVAPAPVDPAEHDRRLLPCPGGKALCEPTLPIVARGVLERAEKYLAECRKCRHRELVTATVTRMRAVARQHERDSRKHEPAGCPASDRVGILISPDSVVAGDAPRVVVAAEPSGPLSIEVVREGGGAVDARQVAAGAGPPWFRVLSLERVERGVHRVVVRSGDEVVACKRFTSGKHRHPRLRKDTVWRSTRDWDRAAENLYSAWIATTFDAHEGKRWKGLGEIFTDASENFLHDHLGLSEDADAGKLALRPDCADAPYVMRAYFAWKLGLPFGRHRCRFGEIDGPPRCGEWESNDTMLSPEASEAAADEEIQPTPVSRHEFRALADRLLDEVTARSLRTSLADDVTDLYPVALERQHLRPGVVFSDPYGHTLTIVKWIEQAPGRSGKLLAVDAQPDGSLGIRRFWRGNFLFVDRHPIGGFGFKAFRPIVKEKDAFRLLDNSEIAVARGYGGFSLAQAKLGAAEFYGTMARLISPTPPPPERELDDLIDALVAQLARRVDEVEVSREIVESRKTPIDMPEGREIFRTTGPWEAASTPCRDLRLLVGMDVLVAFPKEAALDGPAGLREALERRLSERAAQKSIEYPRSDGTRQRLTLAEILARRAAFEMAYNPNDCPELRWGAPEGSPEHASCRRRAPPAQRRAMERMRHWFVKRYSCG
jgi:hypothetical protein